MVSQFIINSCLKKEEKGFKALYQEAIPYVFAITKRYVFDHEVRKDIVQEVFAKIFSNLSQYKPEKGPIKFWIRKITVNQCLMFIRSNKKNDFIISSDNLEFNTAEHTISLDDLSRDDINGLLKEMPEGYRTILLLVVIDDYNHDEVSKLLNISKETSRSQLSRAKKWMKKYFSDEKNKKVWKVLTER